MNIKIVNKKGKTIEVDSIKKYSVNEDNTILNVEKRIPGTKRTKKLFFKIGSIKSIEAFCISALLFLSTTSCSNEIKNSKEAFYFDIDCVEDVIVEKKYIKDSVIYLYSINYYNPDGLCNYNNWTDKLESVQIEIEDVNTFTEFLIDYNEFWDYGGPSDMSYNLGNKWIIKEVDNKYILKQYENNI